MKHMMKSGALLLVLMMVLLTSCADNGDAVTSPASDATATVSETVGEPLHAITISVKTLDKELYEFVVEWKAGDTVLSALQRVAKDNSVGVALSGDGDMAYVTGIGGLNAGDEGAESGWLFRVNGVFGLTSAGATELEAGDVVEWLYTLNWGADWGASF